MSWFEVDRDGLRQLLDGKDKAFVLRELVQNAWDEPGVTRCDVTLEPLPGRPAARLVVEDDAPEGFHDLRHAYTLYARTRKRPDPSKRGRFNLGEKQVLALCREARIVTTKGGVRFDACGKRSAIREKRPAGSVFEAELAMTRAEVDDALRAVRTFIPPPGIATTINGEPLPAREPLAVVEATLATELEDGEGRYRATRRKTEIHVHEPLRGERALLYELGLPVIETGDRWSYDIQQRVPLTADRDNVRPSFLQDVRAAALNACADRLQPQDASERWVRDGAADPEVRPETTRRVADLRWGEKRVVPTPGDRDGLERAIAAGCHVVAPSEMSAAEWDRMREADAVPSSSAAFPTRLVESEPVPAREWTAAMSRLSRIAQAVADIGLNIPITARFIRSPRADVMAQYGSRQIRFNVSRLGPGFWASVEEQIALVVHEIAHEEGSHLTQAYYDCLCRIGARLALADPRLIQG
ncbi:MAG: hypothetical protein ACYTKD_30605 [Planctomycetota bacterium]|jgi:hypothetical protein